MEEIKFNYSVPYNNKCVVALRKKQKLLNAGLTLAASLFLGFFTILSLFSESSNIAITLIFATVFVFALVCSLYCFCSNKPNSKNDNKIISFTFSENSLLILEENSATEKVKKLTNCLYRKYQNKQYVSKVIEHATMFEFKIYIGSYNFVPQFKKHVLPKESVKPEELENLTSFLKQVVGNDYLTKQ